MKSVKIELAGATCYLCMNAAALFAIYDRYGTKGSVLDPIQTGDKAGFEATCWFLATLAEQGELVRRWQGHTPSKIPTEQRFRAMLRPSEASAAKVAIARAASLGFSRDVQDDEPEYVDVGLRELQKKTGLRRVLAAICRSARSFWAWMCGRRIC